MVSLTASRWPPADPRRTPTGASGVGVVLVDDRAVGAQQAERLIDDALEDVAGLADGGDPGGDLAQARCSASARRSMSSRERASSSMRWAFVMAIEAWVASAVSRSTSASV